MMMFINDSSIASLVFLTSAMCTTVGGFASGLVRRAVKYAPTTSRDWLMFSTPLRWFQLKTPAGYLPFQPPSLYARSCVQMSELL